MDALTELKKQKENQLNEKAEKFIKELVDGKKTSTTHTTSSCAPAYGWSVEDYNDMPRVGDILRGKGLKVSSQVKHGVTDWHISL